MIIIYGPTASGKTDFAEQLAQHIQGEIINLDMGQCYTPLSIGTAKPDWRNSPLVQHGFDILSEPCNYTVMAYRTFVTSRIHDIKSRGNVPVLVGGSGFYVKSLLYAPAQTSSTKSAHEKPAYPIDADQCWQLLNEIDPDRARDIHPHDRYRITRALDIWYETGTKPSLCVPAFSPLDDFLVLSITRERSELYKRINVRTELMIKNGWLEEVAQLLNTPWEQFLISKKIIGYDDIINYLRQSNQSLSGLISTIQQKTRNYAKRQLIFASGLEKHVKNALNGDSVAGDWLTLSLTSQPFELYIKQVLNHPYIMKTA